MSRWSLVLVLSMGGFPRVSGDEPVEPSTEYTITEFSPRERG